MRRMMALVALGVAEAVVLLVGVPLILLGKAGLLVAELEDRLRGMRARLTPPP